VLFTGDAIILGTLQSEWDTWFTAAEPVLRQVPMVAQLGNHEANAIHYYSQLALPGDEEYWALDYGPAHVTAVNDSPPVNPGDLIEKGSPFLEKDLAANAGRPWKMVMHHRGLYSSATHMGDVMLRSEWGPIYDKHHVDLALNGHDHDYERSKPMKAGMPVATPAEGTVYLVNGGAGAPPYDNGTTLSTQFSAKTYGYTILRVRVGQLDLKAYDDKATVVDSLTITK
jgi:hypothetical protein